jgi:alpha-N-acetylglucosaminidase
VWADITNWGGNIALHGRLDAIADGPKKARLTDFAAPYLRGTGNVPEGIGTNPVAFDMACEMRWRDSIPSVDEWLHGYAAYRYGKADKQINRAWEALHRTAYGTYKGHRRPTESVLCAVPSMNVTCVSPWGSTHLYYQQADYLKAVKLFAAAKKRFKGCDTYEYDLVDFTRQLVANEGHRYYDGAIRAYKNHEADSVRYNADKFLNLIVLQDRLLSCRPEFCVSTWIDKARNSVSDTTLQRLFEIQARALITTWADGGRHILDYAHREWNGLLKSYYFPRWKMFYEYLYLTAQGKKVPAPDYTTVENGWVKSTVVPRTTQKEDLYKVVDECIRACQH